MGTRLRWTLIAVTAVAAGLLGVIVMTGDPRTTEVSTGGPAADAESANATQADATEAEATTTTMELVPVTGVSPPPPTVPAAAAATAPVFMGAVADAIAGIVTVTFDQPVELAMAMNLIVFSTDARCGAPHGNAHVLLAGGGTRTITLEASSFVPGTNFIGIAPGFVVGTRGKLPNAAVGCTAVSGGPPAAPRYKAVGVDAGAGTVTITFNQSVEASEADELVVFGGGDASCKGTPTATATSIAATPDHRAIVANVTGLTAGPVHLRIGEGLVIGTHGFIANEPERCVRAEGVVPPVLRSVRASKVGDAGGGTTLVLTFDEPVRAAHVDMYVVLYDGAGCDGANGNSHSLIAGEGTETITVDVSGYLAGATNYVRIAPGFVTAVDDGTPNAAVPCTAITT